jgi:hypothetical protein
VNAKGFETSAAEDKAPKNSPGCEVIVVVHKKHERASSASNSIHCRHFTPYASLLRFQATWDSPESKFASYAGQAMQMNSQYGPAGKITSMYIGGAYVFQTSPPIRKPLKILVAALPDGATWTVSDPDVVNLSPLASTQQRLEIGKDGDSDIIVQLATRTLLRIHLTAQTFSDTWQVRLHRATDTGEVIWEDGSYGEQ